MHSKHDAIHSFSGELKKQCIANRDRCESCEQDAVSKKQAELAEKAFENQAEVEAEIHIEEAKTAE